MPDTTVHVDFARFSSAGYGTIYGPRTAGRRVVQLAAITDEDADTIGGLVINRMGRIPKRGESVTTGDLRIQVLRADSRQLHLLRVLRVPGTA